MRTGAIPARPLNLEMWMDGLKRGRTFVTNGPLINFTLGGEMVGSELKLGSPQTAVPFTAQLRSIVPVDHLEVVCNGKVAQIYFHRRDIRLFLVPGNHWNRNRHQNSDDDHDNHKLDQSEATAIARHSVLSCESDRHAVVSRDGSERVIGARSVPRDDSGEESAASALVDNGL